LIERATTRAFFPAARKRGKAHRHIAVPRRSFFEKNAANLVESVETPDHTTYFHYDGNLQRYCIEEDGVATYYVWDGLRLLETRNSDGSLKARFTHGLARIEGIGSCIEIYRASDAKRFHMLYDHRGSAYVLLDGDLPGTPTARIYCGIGRGTVILFSMSLCEIKVTDACVV
jgi:hypothetical protein